MEARHAATGETRLFSGDYFFSTMPVRELVSALQTDVPPEMRAISDGLIYRDFLTVGLLLKKLAVCAAAMVEFLKAAEFTMEDERLIL